MNQIDNINATESMDDHDAFGEQLVLDGMPEPIEEPKVTLTLEQIVEQIIEALGWTETTELTLYQLHKLVNGALAVVGAQKINKQGVLVDYRVSSQMMYTYGSNKLVVKGQVIDKGLTITVAQAATFTKKFVAKFVK